MFLLTKEENKILENKGILVSQCRVEQDFRDIINDLYPPIIIFGRYISLAEVFKREHPDAYREELEKFVDDNFTRVFTEYEHSCITELVHNSKTEILRSLILGAKCQTSNSE